jgi:hypothetical protein
MVTTDYIWSNSTDFNLNTCISILDCSICLERLYQTQLYLVLVVFSGMKVLCFADRASWKIRIIKTNLIYSSVLCLFCQSPLHVSGMLFSIVRRYHYIYIYTTIYTCYTVLSSWLSGCVQVVVYIQWYLLMKGNNMPETWRGDWRSK